MRWKGRTRSQNVEDRRGNGKVAVGGGLGFIGVAIVIALLGGDPTYFLNEGISRTIESASQPRTQISKEEQDELAKFVSVVLAETEDTWGRSFAAQGLDYPEPSMVLFTGAVNSACGQAQSAMGPFYCPLDQKVYIDLDFFYDLKNRHDAPGDFAQAYVVAHEVGHHVQNVLGVLERSNALKLRMNAREANQVSVRTELMADCFAGMWAADSSRKGLLDEGDIEEALNAASRIGDDVLQNQARGYVVPDSFTHGSGAQRYRWFNRGFKTGDLDACDTFAAEDL
ncbi:MAG: neutral zinc metallopeptidase [Alphaproteobacteria bacterium]|nr:neutral zinc metallopeptidase [Alphaproteobacteria bacterium]